MRSHLLLALRAAEPLEVLIKVCEQNSKERNDAIFAIANLYSESVSVATNEGDGKTKRIKDIFAQYHIEKEALHELNGALKRIYESPNFKLKAFRKELTAIRSKGDVNADMRKSQCSEGVIDTLKLVLTYERACSPTSQKFGTLLPSYILLATEALQMRFRS